MKRIAFTILFMSFGLFINIQSAHAASNTPQIDPGYNNKIIDDSIFTNTSTMALQDIQYFLNSKVPVCDTNHQGGDPSQPPPYACLKDYVDPAVGKSAAQIIYDEANRVGLNPQVILVTLQKEQSLVTDTWPYPSQYKSAMGYGCPESQSVCDSQYYGFYNQVHLGATLLRVGLDRDCGNNSSFPGWSVNSQWRVGNSPSVDGLSTYLADCATGSLYNYTPHRPDSAYTLRGGAYFYGNYNFINFFTNWFGSTIAGDFPWKVIQLSGDTRYFLQVGNTKRWIPTNTIYTDWRLDNYSVDQVDQAYFDSVPTIPDLGHVGISGSYYYFVDAGIKHYIPSPKYLQLWGLDPSTIPAPVNSLLSLMPEKEFLGRFAQSSDTSDGRIWLLDGLQKDYVPSADMLYQWGYVQAPTTVSPAYLSSLTTGPDVNRYISFGSANYVVDAGRLIKLSDAVSQDAWTSGAFSALGSSASGFLTSASPSSFVSSRETGEWYMLEGGKKHYIKTLAYAKSWGLSGSASPMIVSQSLLNGMTSGVDLTTVIQESGTGKDYVIDSTKHYIPDLATLNSWTPSGFQFPIFSAVALTRLSEGVQATHAIRVNQLHLFGLDRGTALHFPNLNTLNAWGVPKLTQLLDISDGPLSDLTRGTEASIYVNDGTNTYLLNNGSSHLVPPSLTDGWGATNPTTVTSDLLGRMTTGSQVQALANIGGKVYVASQGRMFDLAQFSDAFQGANPIVQLDSDYFGRVGQAQSYIVQSVDSNDSRIWLISNGQKYYFDNFARMISYGYISKGMPIAKISQGTLDALPTANALAPICIQKAGSGIKFINFGSSLGFPDGATISSACSSIITVSSSIFDQFELRGSLSRVVKGDDGKIYYLENGAKRWIASSTTYSQSYGAMPITYLYSTTMALIPDGANIN